MKKQLLNVCAICVKPFGKSKTINIPMNLTGTWQLFTVHRKCEIAHKKKFKTKLKSSKKFDITFGGFRCYSHNKSYNNPTAWADHMFREDHTESVNTICNHCGKPYKFDVPVKPIWYKKRCPKCKRYNKYRTHLIESI